MTVDRLYIERFFKVTKTQRNFCRLHFFFRVRIIGMGTDDDDDDDDDNCCT